MCYNEKFFGDLMKVLTIISVCFNLSGCGDEPVKEKVESNTKPKVLATLKSNYSMEVPPVELNYESSVPKAQKQARVMYVMDEPNSFSEKLTIATLQGIIANVSDEQIFINNGGYSKYSKYIQEEYDCLTPTMIDGKAATVSSALKHFKKYLSGYILCSDDSNSESGSVAVSLAGILNAVVVTPKNEKVCKELNLKCLLDVSKKNDNWLRSSQYWNKLNKDVAVEQPLNMAPKLVYNGKKAAEHSKKYEFLNDGGFIFGYNNVLGEFDTVNSISKQNLQLIPSDHAYNLSTLSGFKADTIKQKEFDYNLDGNNKHTVCIMMSDGDNVQWILNDFATSNKWYGNANRGKINLGWGIAPTAIDLIAPMNAYLFDNMAAGDEFVAQLSGLGYTFPSRWNQSERKSMAAKLSEYMFRTNVKYAEILDDAGMKKDVLSDFTEQKYIKGLFYIDYANYAGNKGDIIWTNNKPTVSAKYRLWAGIDDGSIKKIASKINNTSTDPKNKNSYSFIIVHAWSGLNGDKLVANGNTMDAVKKLIDSFDDDVEVVTPSVFMDRIVSNDVK